MPPKLRLSIGSKLDVQDKKGNWQMGRVMAYDAIKKELLIHFCGWSKDLDEWLHMPSNRIAPRGTRVKNKRTNVAPTMSKSEAESLAVDSGGHLATNDDNNNHNNKNNNNHNNNNNNSDASALAGPFDPSQIRPNAAKTMGRTSSSSSSSSSSINAADRVSLLTKMTFDHLPRHIATICEREVEIYQDYLKEVKLRETLTPILNSLLANPGLPYNPYVNLLAQTSNLILEQTLDTTSSYDVSLYVRRDVDEDKNTHIATQKGDSQVFGLPHLVQFLNIRYLKKMTRSLHQADIGLSFDKLGTQTVKGYKVHTMTSVNGKLVLTPHIFRGSFPIEVKQNILVVGPQLQNALVVFANRIYKRVKALMDESEHIFQALRVESWANDVMGRDANKDINIVSVPYRIRAKNMTVDVWHPSRIQGKKVAFTQAIKAAVQDHNRIILELLVQMPIIAQSREYENKTTQQQHSHSYKNNNEKDSHSTDQGDGKEVTTLYQLSIEVNFHWSAPDASPDQIHHFGFEHGALLEGVFVSRKVMEKYRGMFKHKTTEAKVVKPYRQHLKARAILAQMEGDFFEMYYCVFLEQILHLFSGGGENISFPTILASCYRMVNSSAGDWNSFYHQASALQAAVGQFIDEPDEALLPALMYLSETLFNGVMDNIHTFTSPQLCGVQGRIKSVLNRLGYQPDLSSERASTCSINITVSSASLLGELSLWCQAIRNGIAQEVAQTLPKTLEAMNKFIKDSHADYTAKNVVALPYRRVIDVKAVTERNAVMMKFSGDIETDGVLMQYVIDTELDVFLFDYLFDVFTGSRPQGHRQKKSHSRYIAAEGNSGLVRNQVALLGLLSDRLHAQSVRFHCFQDNDDVINALCRTTSTVEAFVGPWEVHCTNTSMHTLYGLEHNLHGVDFSSIYTVFGALTCVKTNPPRSLIDQTVAIVGNGKLYGHFLKELAVYEIEKRYYIEGKSDEKCVSKFVKEVVRFVRWIEQRIDDTLFVGMMIDDEEVDLQDEVFATKILKAVRENRPIYAQVYLIVSPVELYANRNERPDKKVPPPAAKYVQAKIWFVLMYQSDGGEVEIDAKTGRITDRGPTIKSSCVDEAERWYQLLFFDQYQVKEYLTWIDKMYNNSNSTNSNNNNKGNNASSFSSSSTASRRPRSRSAMRAASPFFNKQRIRILKEAATCYRHHQLQSCLLLLLQDKLARHDSCLTAQAYRMARSFGGVISSLSYDALHLANLIHDALDDSKVKEKLQINILKAQVRQFLDRVLAHAVYSEGLTCLRGNNINITDLVETIAQYHILDQVMTVNVVDFLHSLNVNLTIKAFTAASLFFESLPNVMELMESNALSRSKTGV